VLNTFPLPSDLAAFASVASHFLESPQPGRRGVQVGVDEAGQDGAPAQVKPLGAGLGLRIREWWSREARTDGG